MGRYNMQHYRQMKIFIRLWRLLSKKNRNFAVWNMKDTSALNRLHNWRISHISEYGMTLILSVVVGLGSGLAAVLLKNLVHTINGWLLGFSLPLSFGGNGLMLVYPIVGICLTVLFVKYVVGGDIGHGVPEVLLSISRHQGVLPPKNTWASLMASTITVAFGGSVGLEAPIASTGSAIGSNIGRIFHMGPKNVKLLLGCGAAGAVAGIFKAPIAGLMFVVEILMFDFTKTAAIPLLFSALTSTLVAHFAIGPDVQFAFVVNDTFSLSQIPFYLLLGVVCAFVSIYFLRTSDFVEDLLHKIKNSALKVLIGGAALGLMIFLFPALFGEGYGSLTKLMAGHGSTLMENTIFSQMPIMESPWMGVIFLSAIVLLKVIATSTTIGSGGVGGTFGPSLIIGGMTGYALALFCNNLGLPAQSTANFALVGMAAVMTGVMHAPLMATFLIAEITGGYELLVPLLIAAATTTLVINPFEKHSIYARKLALHGDLLTHDIDSSAWQLINMRELIQTNFVIVRVGDRLRDLIEAIKNSKRNVFPVLTNDDKFIGVIHLDSVRHIIFRPEKYDEYEVTQLMTPISEGDIVHISDSPESVVAKFQGSNRYNLIVLDDDETYLGILSKADCLTAYRQFVAEASEE